jgi:LTXXQ motif family protein
MAMKLRMSRSLSSLSVAAALALTSVAASAQNAPETGGQDHMKGRGMSGGQDHMMGGGMGGGQDHMMGGGMKGGQGHMMGGGQDHMSMMSHMMSMMQERLSHTADRIASLKGELKITEAQLPAWNKFADTVLTASKSMQAAMEGMQHEMMQHGSTAAETGGQNYPDFGAIKKTAGAEAAAAAKGLPAKLLHREEMLKQRLANLQAIKEALDPLYASFSDEQKKIADGLKLGPMM